MRKNPILFAAAVLIVLTAVSCQKEAPKTDEGISVSTTSLLFDPEGGDHTVSVIANAEWTASTEADWLTITPSNDGRTFKATASKNIAAAGSCADERNATINISAGTNSAVISVAQSEEAEVFKLEYEPNPAKFPEEGGMLDVTVSSNIGACDVTIPSDAPWITKVSTKAAVESRFSFAIAANTGDARESTITFTSKDGSTRSISVNQVGKFKDILSVSPTSLTFKMNGGEQRVEVTTFSEWTAVPNVSWLSVVPSSDGTSFVVTASVNQGEGGQPAVERTGVIKVSTPTKSVDVAVTQNGLVVPDGAINGLFSVSAEKQVYFSKGNLTYTVSTSRWGFFANQYDRAATYDANVISLFTWGYGSWSTDPQTASYETSKFVDWGNALDNAGTWRTLTNDEWKYLLGTRGTGSTYYRIGVTVCGVADCVVLAPDGNKVEIAGSYDETSWKTSEAAGFVCLPNVGYRYNASIDFGYGSYYWSSTIIYNSSNAYGVNFKGGKYSCAANGRNWPYAVRLVSDK